MEKRNIHVRNVPSINHHRAFKNKLESFKENGSKVSISKKGGSRMNEIENSSGDRNLLDWTPMNIPGSKILFLVSEGKETTRSDPRESLERVKSESK
ncbi:hypothetical protein Tco_0181633 [Tanacetum coccineum]